MAYLEHGWKIGIGYEDSMKARASGKFLGLEAEGQTTYTFSISGEAFGNYSSSRMDYQYIVFLPYYLI
ncbi:MAG: hypothetical protein QNJ18_15690 [Xenococcaceae cyanobacterium MO_167.B52]|nr:hypothetical protein [Xenococcaceae cyanobacterium MO_167.B52]